LYNRFDNRLYRVNGVLVNVVCDGQALNLGVIGPCLLDLEALAGLSESRGRLSTVFTVRGLLAICASVTLGPVLDRVDHYLLVGVALLVDFIMYSCVTQCTSLTTLLVTLGPPEFVNCGVGMGQSTLLSRHIVKCILLTNYY